MTGSAQRSQEVACDVVWKNRSSVWPTKEGLNKCCCDNDNGG